MANFLLCHNTPEACPILVVVDDDDDNDGDGDDNDIRGGV
jgi:hypothetical protein